MHGGLPSAQEYDVANTKTRAVRGLGTAGCGNFVQNATATGCPHYWLWPLRSNIWRLCNNL
eukprot:6203521-Pleurochrysis_carterae.AAC.1